MVLSTNLVASNVLPAFTNPPTKMLSKFTSGSLPFPVTAAEATRERGYVWLQLSSSKQDHKIQGDSSSQPCGGISQHKQAINFQCK
jgi:hypothetical protein